MRRRFAQPHAGTREPRLCRTPATAIKSSNSRTISGLAALVLIVTASFHPPLSHSQILSSNAHPPSVGMEGQLEVLLPEHELSAKAPNRQSPILVRIAFTRPHGTLTHYDLRFIGQVPGDYDLRDHLFLPNGQAATHLEPIRVTVSGILPTPHNGWLEEHALRAPSLFKGYRSWMIALIALWAASLFVIVRLGRKPKSATLEQPPPPPPTFAERLRPLVERAVAGRLSADEKAALERMLITHWQRRLGLTQADGGELILRLREHPEAGVLLRGLEDWLHRPPGRTTVPVESILAPYRIPPAEETAATPQP